MNEGQEPGWFPDPSDPDRTRYWDGTAWTHDVNSAADAEDDLATLMGIPDERDWETPKRAVAIGAVVGVALLLAGWVIFSGDGSDGDDGTEGAAFEPTPGAEAAEDADVLGSTEAPSTTSIAPTTTSPPTTTTTIPVVPLGDLTGLSAGDARFSLEVAGLIVTVDEVADQSAPTGTVVAQDPSPGEVEAGSSVTLTVAAAACNDASGPIPATTFIDVILTGSPTDAIAVGWAKQANIISGVQPDVFGVDVPLSRAALVSMLHRYFCEPAPELPLSFTDVAPGAFYADAAAWATGEGIVSGTGGGAFDPAGVTTRAQWVTVLWRALGEPAAEVALPFTDVTAGAYYEPALKWVVANNLMTGTSPTTFSPDAVLTRLDATALLYLLESTLDPVTS